MHNEKTQVVYLYDGSFEGFLTCVYEYYYSFNTPVDIVSDEDFSASFYPILKIETDTKKASKVKKAIEEKISFYSPSFLKDCLLCTGIGVEMNMLLYVVNGFKYGGGIYHNYKIDCVNFLRKAERNLEKEKHLYLGITRFSKINDTYIAKVEPNNRILYKIQDHFLQRNFDLPIVIYDVTHKEVLLGYKFKAQIVKVDKLDIPDITKDEKELKALWKNYYDTISIKERYNPRCRDNFIPKYRHKYMDELN